MCSNEEISNTIKHYFPKISASQLETFEQLPQLYKEWNEKINVISRKDIENIFSHHILHSLAIAKLCSLKPNSEILDVGTGGGFPGIPLAIMFPEVNFTLVDSIGKKIKVVQGIKEALNLKNVNPIWARAETIDKKFDFIVSRAVTNLASFVPLVRKNISKIEYHKIDNGILYLKGGDIDEEIKELKQYYTNTQKGKTNKPIVKMYDIYDFFPLEYFETKKIIHIKL
ncbi:MAG: 16S rRNA (guanine(527)-N(7))-methyltransferase RsmG [Bacteroidales bacterium]|jgi:16S rRNA (guanine527-N7)-methyltransferase|nr:16S rRNA (guanine(527)-N(7))-methyltransferase RsmG [Bacteroidales bacterium]